MEPTKHIAVSRLERWADYLECQLEREYEAAVLAKDAEEMSQIRDMIDGRKAEGGDVVAFLDNAVEYLAQFEEM